MHDQPRTHVGLTRRIRCADGLVADLTINLSGIPATAGEDLIRNMMGTANTAIAVILEETERRAAEGLRVHRPAPRFDPSAIETVPGPVIQPQDGPSVADAIAQTVAAMDLGAAEPILADEDVEVPTMTALGVTVPAPPDEWYIEPLTTTNESGGQGGQLLALNAALTAIGYKDRYRHVASQAILGAFDGTDIEPIASLKDLTRAQAHLILSWIDAADEDARAALDQTVCGPSMFAQEATPTPTALEQLQEMFAPAEEKDPFDEESPLPADGFMRGTASGEAVASAANHEQDGTGLIAPAVDTAGGCPTEPSVTGGLGEGGAPNAGEITLSPGQERVVRAILAAAGVAHHG